MYAKMWPQVQRRVSGTWNSSHSYNPAISQNWMLQMTPSTYLSPLRLFLLLINMPNNSQPDTFIRSQKFQYKLKGKMFLLPKVTCEGNCVVWGGNWIWRRCHKSIHKQRHSHFLPFVYLLATLVINAANPWIRVTNATTLITKKGAPAKLNEQSVKVDTNLDVGPSSILIRVLDEPHFGRIKVRNLIKHLAFTLQL